MDKFKKLAADVIIEKLIDKDYFDVGLLDDLHSLMERRGHPVQSWQYKKLVPIHCVKWSKMDEDLKEEVMATVLTLLEPEPEPEKKGFFARLFS